MNHGETSAPNPLASQSVASILIFCFCRKVFLEVGRKLFLKKNKKKKHVFSASDSDKRHGRFFLFFFCAPFCRRAFSLLVVSHKARALVSKKKLKAPFKCRLLFLFLSVFLSSPCAVFFFPPAGLLCVTYAPLPPGSTPSVLPRDPRSLLLLFEEAGRKSSEPHSKEKKSL